MPLTTTRGGATTVAVPRTFFRVKANWPSAVVRKDPFRYSLRSRKSGMTTAGIGRRGELAFPSEAARSVQDGGVAAGDGAAGQAVAERHGDGVPAEGDRAAVEVEGGLPGDLVAGAGAEAGVVALVGAVQGQVGEGAADLDVQADGRLAADVEGPLPCAGPVVDLEGGGVGAGQGAGQEGQAGEREDRGKRGGLHGGQDARAAYLTRVARSFKIRFQAELFDDVATLGHGPREEVPSLAAVVQALARPVSVHR